jgi:phosphate transport system permease protein
MTELTRKSDPRLIARRYAAERRFRLYGIAALVLTTAFLFVLISDIVWRSLPAFTQYHAVLEVTVDPEKIDASNPAAGDFEGMVKTAWRDQFPSVASRADRRLLNGLVSGAGGNELRRLVLADPSLIGKAVTVPVMLSDDADLFLKGQVTSVSRVPGQGPLRIRAEGENYFLSAQGVGPGSIILADGGAFKIAAEGDSAPAEVIAAPGGASEIAQGQWQVLNFGVPESERKITDRAAVWLELVREKGSLERQIAWNFFLNGDSREAELSGILGSLVGSLMVVFITVALSLPAGCRRGDVPGGVCPPQPLHRPDRSQHQQSRRSALGGVRASRPRRCSWASSGMPRSIPLVGGLVLVA